MARTDIEIRAVDKTQDALRNIDKRLGSLDKNVGKLERGFDGLTSKIIAAGAAIGTAFGVKRILRVGADVEKLQLRFQFLFRSVDEGTEAFRQMLQFAGEVPFTLEEIQRGAGNLAVVSANAKELGENLRLVGNIAAVSGLDFQTAAEQLQRSFASGINASELFRERGVKAMLGFRDGVKYSVEETRNIITKAFGPGGPYEKAAFALSTTFDGVFSMLQDKLLQFQLALANQGGLLEYSKGALTALDDYLGQSQEKLTEFAAIAGQKIIEFVEESLIGFARIADGLKPLFLIVAAGFDGLFKVLNSLPPGAREIGLIGFVMLGKKGKALALLFGYFFDYTRKGIGLVLQGFVKLNMGILKVRKALGLVSNEDYEKIKQQTMAIKETADQLVIPFEELKETGGETTRVYGDFEKKMRQIFKNIEAGMDKNKKQAEELKKIIGDIPIVSEEQKKQLEILEKAAQTIGGDLGRDILGKEDPKVVAYREAIESLEKLREIDVANEEKYAKRIAMIKAQQAREQAAESKQRIDKALSTIKAGEDARTDLEELKGNERFKVAAKHGKDLLSQVATQNEKAFKIMKALAIAEAIIAAKTSIVNSYRVGSAAGGPILGGIFAGLAAAATAAQIAAIKATKYTGPRERGGGVAQGQSYLVGEKGPEMFTPSASGQITPNNGMGSVNVNFNIETNDASGFDELLIERRNTIVGIINQALNQRGQQGVTT